MKINRRELGALVAITGAAAAAAKAVAQPPSQTPPPAGARDFLAEARLQHIAESRLMAGVELPQSTEPAFEFRP